MTLPPLPPDLPPQVVENFQRLLAFPLDTPERMQVAVERHMHNIQQAAPHFPQVNLTQARQVADGLKPLLHYAPETTPPIHQHWIQAAARYFFLNDDGTHDWADSHGFEDDLAVVEAVARALVAGQPES